VRSQKSKVIIWLLRATLAIRVGWMSVAASVPSRSATARASSAVAVRAPRAMAKIEGLRSKLNKLAERGWLALEGPGMFVLPPQVAGSVAEGVGKPAR
jgi:hypothetical protein